MNLFLKIVIGLIALTWAFKGMALVKEGEDATGCAIILVLCLIASILVDIRENTKH